MSFMRKAKFPSFWAFSCKALPTMNGLPSGPIRPIRVWKLAWGTGPSASGLRKQSGVSSPNPLASVGLQNGLAFHWPSATIL